MASFVKNIVTTGHPANNKAELAVDIGKNVVIPLITAVSAALAFGKGVNRIFFNGK